jgi:hypothetical protein
MEMGEPLCGSTEADRKFVSENKSTEANQSRAAALFVSKDSRRD